MATIHGMAAPIGRAGRQNTRSGKSFLTTNQQGCFDSCLNFIERGQHNVNLVVNHADEQIAASTRDGSLQLWADDSGLYFEAELRQNQHSRAIENALNKKQVGCSVSFYTAKKSVPLDSPAITSAEFISVGHVDHIGVIIDGSPVFKQTWTAFGSARNKPLTRSQQQDKQIEALRIATLLNQSRSVIRRRDQAARAMGRSNSQLINMLPWMNRARLKGVLT